MKRRKLYNKKFSIGHWDNAPSDDIFLKCIEGATDQHRREIWAYKMKESDWIRTKNQLDGHKSIVNELSEQVLGLKKEIDRLSEENNNLRTIDSSHQELNGKLRKQITEVEVEMANLKAIGNNSPEMRNLQRDNKYLVEKVRDYQEMLKKAGL